MIFKPYYCFETGCAAYLFGCGGLGKCAVVDAHEEDVEGALNIPLDVLAERAAELSKDAVLVTACGKGGGRSEQGAARRSARRCGSASSEAASASRVTETSWSSVRVRRG